MNVTEVVVRSYADISSVLASLGDPRPGARRLFRGQDRAYFDPQTSRHLLLPAIARPGGPHTYDPAWLVTIEHYFMQEMTGGGYQVSGPVMTVWAPALLQHYGPGSAYLDVTSDLETALWFALHRYDHHTFFLAAPGHINRYVHCSWYADLPATAEPVLYVLDSPAWNNTGVPVHGEVVDLLALGAGILPEQASRLRRQHASLIYSQMDSPSGPNLDTHLRAVIHLGAGFDRATVASYYRPAAQVFPPPSADGFYNLLLQVPCRVVLDPLSLQHPLSIPCYLTETPPDALNSTAVPPEIASYAALATPVHPPFCHSFLLNDPAGEPGGPITAADRSFRFADAMPIVLEAPLWLILPSVSVPAIAADWITSALPFDIADQIADRPTDSVYFELSALEHYGPRPDAIPESGVIYARAIWLIRAAGRFICTIYAVDSGKLFSYIVEYTFSAHTGTFERVRWTNEPAQLDETLQSVFNTALKCLYLALTVLRDLSPGFKPPAVIANAVEVAPGVLDRLLGTMLEPQAGFVTAIKDTPYLVPKARSGTTYLRASGSEPNASELWRSDPQGYPILARAFDRIRDPWYLMEAAIELSTWYGSIGQHKNAVVVANRGFEVARSQPESKIARTWESMLANLRDKSAAQAVSV